MAPLVLRKDILHNYYGDSPDDIRGILLDYCNAHNEIMTSLHQAFHKSMEALRSCVHFHSCAFSYVGFPQLHTECKNLEALCKQTDDVNDVCAEYETLMRRIAESGRLVQAEIGLALSIVN